MARIREVPTPSFSDGQMDKITAGWPVLFSFLSKWRTERSRRRSEWHPCRLPLFREIQLVEPKIIFFDYVMRRQFNGVWQYRAMTDQEYSDFKDRQSQRGGAINPASACP
jgi:hypothetical protein